MDLQILDLLDESIHPAWQRVDDELRLPVAGGNGMMHASVRVDDGTVFVTEFDPANAWSIAGEYRLSGSPSVMGPRAVALLDALAEERA